MGVIPSAWELVLCPLLPSSDRLLLGLQIPLFINPFPRSFILFPWGDLSWHLLLSSLESSLPHLFMWSCHPAFIPHDTDEMAAVWVLVWVFVCYVATFDFDLPREQSCWFCQSHIPNAGHWAHSRQSENIFTQMDEWITVINWDCNREDLGQT